MTVSFYSARLIGNNFEPTVPEDEWFDLTNHNFAELASRLMMDLRTPCHFRIETMQHALHVARHLGRLESEVDHRRADQLQRVLDRGTETGATHVVAA